MFLHLLYNNSAEHKIVDCAVIGIGARLSKSVTEGFIKGQATIKNKGITGNGMLHRVQIRPGDGGAYGHGDNLGVEPEV